MTIIALLIAIGTAILLKVDEVTDMIFVIVVVFIFVGSIIALIVNFPLILLFILLGYPIYKLYQSQK